MSSVVVAPDGTVHTLVRDALSVRVASLQRPDIAVHGGTHIEFAEEGDLLYGVMQREAARQPLCVAPVLCLPLGMGSHFGGEMFRGHVSFRNHASYPLLRLTLRIEVITPVHQQTRLYDSENVNMPPGGTKDVRVETRLVDAGDYKLVVTASFTDFTGEPRRLARQYNVGVGRAFQEVRRRVYLLHPGVSGVSASSTVGAAPAASSAAAREGTTARIGVSFTLQNVSGEVIAMTNVRFIPKETQAGTFMIAFPPQTGDMTLVAGGASRVDDPVDSSFGPGDTRTYYYELVPRFPLIPGGAAPLTTLSARAPSIELGHFQWDWRRGCGNGGVETSGILKLLRPQPKPEIELIAFLDPAEPLVTTTTTDRAALLMDVAATAAERASSRLGANTSPLPPASVVVGQPCRLQLTILNHSALRKRDLLLRVNVQNLLPEIAYTGHCNKLLGMLGPLGELQASIQVIPLVAGLTSIVGALELRDATAPDTVLWPLPPSASIVAAAEQLRAQTAGTASYNVVVNPRSTAVAGCSGAVASVALEKVLDAFVESTPV